MAHGVEFVSKKGDWRFANRPFYVCSSAFRHPKRLTISGCRRELSWQDTIKRIAQRIEKRPTDSGFHPNFAAQRDPERALSRNKKGL
jgi:hypothetical protein